MLFKFLVFKYSLSSFNCNPHFRLLTRGLFLKFCVIIPSYYWSDLSDQSRCNKIETKLQFLVVPNETELATMEAKVQELMFLGLSSQSSKSTRSSALSLLSSPSNGKIIKRGNHLCFPKDQTAWIWDVWK